jgi:hypothetical protein
MSYVNRTPGAKKPGYLHPWAAVARAEEAALDEARARAAAEQDAFEREVLALRHDFAKLKLDYELRRFHRKYSPNQPRVPAGSHEGGQWTSGGSSAPSSDSALGQDQRSSLATAQDQAPRSDLPQLQALANDQLIRSRIDEAWAASNPNGTRPQEQGFWISRNEATGEVFTRPFASPGFGDSIRPGATPDDAVAFFHTHPNRPDSGYDAGPSVADGLLATRRDLPGLIQSHNGMYYFGPPLRPAKLR